MATPAPAGRARPAGAALVALTLLLALAGCSRHALQAQPADARAATATTLAGRDTPVPTLPIYSWTRLPPSPPTRLEIPAIGIDSKLVKLGLDAGGKMQVPQGRDYHLAGWFTGGPEPGQLGPAIIAGHVDSKTGPSIFYRLHDLKPGDPVRVTRADGRRLEFVVTERRQYPKADLPAQDVFGPVPWPALRLITCGGSFDRSAGSYRDNIVVSTRLKGT